MAESIYFQSKVLNQKLHLNGLSIIAETKQNAIWKIHFYT